MNINKIDKSFYPNLKNKKYFCRNCSNTFFSKFNIMITLNFVDQIK